MTLRHHVSPRPPASPQRRRSRGGIVAPELRLPTLAVASVLAAILVVVLSGGSSPTRSIAAPTRVARSGDQARASMVSGSRTVTVTETRSAPSSRRHHHHVRRPSWPAGHAQLSLAREVGQLVIATYAGVTPPQSMLDAVRSGQVGAIILMGDNTAGGAGATRSAISMLQAAARAGGNPGLLIMTDQEGGEVKRLSEAPPSGSAEEMGRVGDSLQQGEATGRFLRSVGVNVDLAPVADVVRTDGFIEQEQRSFGSQPRRAANAACGFATGLKREGVAYTLKHFPGLGDAVQSTDSVPVSIPESFAMLSADDQAYRLCGAGPLALVMVSSASYPSLTGSTPAVLSPTIYNRVLPEDGVRAVTISDSFESGAIEHLVSPALRAINAGLDMVMYPGTQSASAYAYEALLADAQRGALRGSQLRAAVGKILALKRALRLR